MDAICQTVMRFQKNPGRYKIPTPHGEVPIARVLARTLNAENCRCGSCAFEYSHREPARYHRARTQPYVVLVSIMIDVKKHNLSRFDIEDSAQRCLQSGSTNGSVRTQDLLSPRK